ncbi:MAG: hypothetical protein HYX72_12440 [Acidobacteria bacterium]|nr:hypothetical protein [Acidobacteriota bacterium]
MNAAALAKVIQGNPCQLLDELNAELRSNLGTSHYHRLTEEELIKRHAATFQSLSEWLANRDVAVLRKNGEDLGRRRFREATPLGQVILVLILVEKHLCTFLDGSHQVDPEARDAVTEFFQKFAYYTAKGYESELAASNTSVRRVAPGRDEFLKKDAAKSAERDMEISRGGQVGEHGG